MKSSSVVPAGRTHGTGLNPYKSSLTGFIKEFSATEMSLNNQKQKCLHSKGDSLLTVHESQSESKDRKPWNLKGESSSGIFLNQYNF